MLRRSDDERGLSRAERLADGQLEQVYVQGRGVHFLILQRDVGSIFWATPPGPELHLALHKPERYDRVDVYPMEVESLLADNPAVATVSRNDHVVCKVDVAVVLPERPGPGRSPALGAAAGLCRGASGPVPAALVVLRALPSTVGEKRTGGRSSSWSPAADIPCDSTALRGRHPTMSDGAACLTTSAQLLWCSWPSLDHRSRPRLGGPQSSQ